MQLVLVACLSMCRQCQHGVGSLYLLGGSIDGSSCNDEGGPPARAPARSVTVTRAVGDATTMMSERSAA